MNNKEDWDNVVVVVMRKSEHWEYSLEENVRMYVWNNTEIQGWDEESYSRVEC